MGKEMKLEIGVWIKARGRSRCVTITGRIIGYIAGGYKVQDSDGLICHIRHEYFDIEVQK